MNAHESEIRVQARPFHVKAGYKTTEFWVSLLVVIVSCLIVSEQTRTSGIDRNGAIALASAALTSFGYSRARAAVKTGR